MEKYAVVIDDEKTKTAGEGKNCPQCGQVINPPEGSTTTDWWCSKCGTKPFEKRPTEEK